MSALDYLCATSMRRWPLQVGDVISYYRCYVTLSLLSISVTLWKHVANYACSRFLCAQRCSNDVNSELGEVYMMYFVFRAQLIPLSTSCASSDTLVRSNCT